MEAENQKARLKAKLRFTLVFAIALIVTTTGDTAGMRIAARSCCAPTQQCAARRKRPAPRCWTRPPRTHA